MVFGVASLQLRSVVQVTVHKASFKMDPGSARCEFVHVEALHADGSMAALDRDGKLMLFNAGNVIDKLISTRVRYIEARTVNAKVSLYLYLPLRGCRSMHLPFRRAPDSTEDAAERKQ